MVINSAHLGGGKAKSLKKKRCKVNELIYLSEKKCNATCGYVAKVEKTNIAGDDGCSVLWIAETVPIDKILSVKNALAWV